jgi:hypothetical protein
MVTINDVESSAQLYRLISKECLHLRSKNGRDDALIKRLAIKLGLDPKKPIPKQLERNKIPLEEFIQEFFLLSEPFSKMLSQIYLVMQIQNVQTSTKSIRMKFRFGSVTKKLDFDLKRFRDWLAIYQKFQGDFFTRLWTQRDIDKLYRPIAKLRKIFGESSVDVNTHYPSALPESFLLNTDDRWKPLKMLRDSMEQLRRILSQEKVGHNVDAISVLREEHDVKQHAEPILLENRLNLTDIWPGLFRLLLQLEKLPSLEDLPSEAVESLEEIGFVTEKVERTRMKSVHLVRNFVELLRLPFWKYRWRLYEVWVLLKLIACLDEYDCKLESIAGRMLLEENKPSKVAQLRDLDSSIYEVWTQLETAVFHPLKRKHIMPDIRLCRPNASLPENTFLVIECKQRKQMKTKELTELVEDYMAGAENSVLLLFVNYDTFPPFPPKFPKACLLSNVSPTNPHAVEEFTSMIKKTLFENGVKPSTQQMDAIIFDVSGSMRGKYTSQDIGDACEKLVAENPRARIFFFSDHLLSTGMLSGVNLKFELDAMIGGSTNLDGVLRELAEKYTNLKRVAVVTDGEYDRPLTAPSLFEKVEELVLEKNFPANRK